MNLPLPIYDVESHVWRSARSPGKGRRLFPLGPAETAIDAAKHKSFEEIRKGRGRNFARTQKTFVCKTAPQVAAALDLLPGFEFESAIVQGQIDEYDPLCYNQISIGRLQHKTRKDNIRYAAAFPGGVDGSQLMISGLRKAHYAWENRPNLRLQVGELEAPQTVWDFGTAIQSVKFAGKEGSGSEARSREVGVRTANKVAILRIYQEHNLRLKGPDYSARTLIEFGPYELGKIPTADFTINPWAARADHQIAIIDSSGNWGVWDKDKSPRLDKSLWRKGKLLGDVDLAPCRITYGQDQNSLLMSNRNRFELIDLRASTDKVPLMDASKAQFPFKIYDIKRWGLGSTSASVLTSKEIMWLDMRMPGRSVMSVKHYRSPEDASLSCEVFTMDSETTAIIHSRTTNYATAYQFGRGDGDIPSYLDNAYEIPYDSGAQCTSMAIFPLRLTKKNSGNQKHYLPSLQEKGQDDDLFSRDDLHFMSILRLQEDLGVNTQLFATDDLGKVDFKSGLVKHTSVARVDSESEGEREEDDDLDDADDVIITRPLKQLHVQIRDFSQLYNKIYPIEDPELLTHEAEDAVAAYCSAVRANLVDDKHATLLDIKAPSTLFHDLPALASEFPDAQPLPSLLPSHDPEQTYNLLLSTYFHQLGPTCHPLIRIRRERICRLLATHAFLANSTPPIPPAPEPSTALTRLARFSSTTPTDIGSYETGTDERTRRILDDWKVDEKLEDYEWNENGALAVRFDGLNIRRREAKDRREILSQQRKERRESRRQSGFQRMAATQVESQQSQGESSQAGAETQETSQGASQGESQQSQRRITMSQVTPGKFGGRTPTSKKGQKRRKLGF